MSETRLKTLTCDERNELIGDGLDWHVASSLTDVSGRYGRPRIETLWTQSKRQSFIGLRDVRHPADGGRSPDAAPCEHYVEMILEERDELSGDD